MGKFFPGRRVSDLQWCSGGPYVLLNVDGRYQIRNMHTFQPVKCDNLSDCDNVGFTSDGCLIFTRGNRIERRRIDLDGCKLLHSTRLATDVHDLLFAHSGHSSTAIRSCGWSIQAVDTETLDIRSYDLRPFLADFYGKEKALEWVLDIQIEIEAISSNGQRVVFTHGDNLLLFSTSNLERLTLLTPDRNDSSTIRISNDGRYIARDGYMTLEIWYSDPDVPLAHRLSLPNAESWSLACISFGHSDSTIVAGNSRGETIFFDLNGGCYNVSKYKTDERGIQTIAWSPTGDLLVYGTDRGTTVKSLQEVRETPILVHKPIGRETKQKEERQPRKRRGGEQQKVKRLRGKKGVRQRNVRKQKHPRNGGLTMSKRRRGS